MKTQLMKRACAAILAVSLFGCGGGGDDPVVVPLMTVDASGFSTVNVGQLQNVVATYPLQSLSTAEAESLAYMREEEQLAHDVYAVSAGLWTVPVFANITNSEATHSAAIK
ncbi:MAG TPA: DUF2202 domain-containing protein, partial [Rhodoferax sp.]|nr:DUF2202 domain-containing protein [Rhodoferax sp.]